MLSPGIIKEACLSSLRSGHSHEDVDQTFGRLASFLVKRGHSCETPDDFQQVIKQFLQESVFPHEPPSNRYCVKLDQTRDWSFGITHGHFFPNVQPSPSIFWTVADQAVVTMAVVSSAVLSRKAFLAQAVPIHLKGIGGPGAPHECLFQRRCNTGYLDQLGPVRDRRPFQQFIYIPKYIIFILYIM